MADEKTENINSYDSNLLSGKSIIWSSVLFVLILTLTVLLAVYVLSEENLYYPYKLTSSLNLIESQYPDDSPAHQMIDNARDAIFDQLDRYSSYIEPTNYSRVTEEFTGNYSGIGITVIGHDSGLMIMSVREDGPAGKAGLLTGDIITRADTVSFKGKSSYQASFYLRGKEGTALETEVIRHGFSENLVFNLTRKKLKLIHIPYVGITENHSLYIRVLDFETGLYDELSEALDSVYNPNRDSIKSIILDLRGNPGGLLSEAINVADLFLDEDKIIVGIKGRSIWNRKEYRSQSDDYFDSLPVAVLVDRGSASASEILAGSLRFAERAILIGDTTFGKGLVQQYSGFGDGSGLRLTTSRYYFEGEKYINRPSDSILDSADGIPPDYFIKSIAYESFGSWLESSGYLRQFAIENSAEIADYAPFSSQADKWLEKFKEYTIEKGFGYLSDMSKVVDFTKDEIIFENMSPQIYEAVDQISQISREEDKKLLEQYGDYIKMRIFQIAVEAKSGTAVGYKTAIVPYRPDIALAEKILSEPKKSIKGVKN